MAELFKFGRDDPAATISAELEKFGHEAILRRPTRLLFASRLSPLA